MASFTNENPLYFLGPTIHPRGRGVKVRKGSQLTERFPKVEVAPGETLLAVKDLTLRGSPSRFPSRCGGARSWASPG